MEDSKHQSRNDSLLNEVYGRVGASTKVKWDETSAERISPDAFRVNFTADQVAIGWGTPVADEATDAFHVRISNQTVMNPYTAKQLAHALAIATRQYEERYGKLEVEAAQRKSSLHKRVGNSEREEYLIALLKNFNSEMEFERSFKISQNSLLKNRFLLGVGKSAIGDGAYSKIENICLEMGMPDSYLECFKEKFSDANYIHFGFEENQFGCLYKVYLEFLEQVRGAIDNNLENRTPRLLHLAFKWDPSENTKQAVTYYTLHPWLSAAEMISRAEETLSLESAGGPPVDVAGIIRLASGRVLPHDLLYLEVTEEGNPRRSFDINMYRAGLRLAELYPFLGRIARRSAIPYRDFHDHYESIKSERFGHLAGGTDRQGSPFFTVYYGSEGLSGHPSRNGQKSETILSRSLFIEGMKGRRIQEDDEHAKHLFELVKGIGVRPILEHSFKFLPGTLLVGRFLAGIKREQENAGKDEAILKICEQIGMPSDFQVNFLSELSQANFVLFGFEKNERSRIYKAYLEFSARLAEAVRQEPRPESVIVHTGFKWDISDPSKKAAAEYRALPLFRAVDIAERIFGTFYKEKDQSSFRIVDDFIDLAGTRTRPGELLYFEVTEENNVRKSFDLNMYFAGLTVAEVYPLLAETARRFSIGMPELEERYEAVKNQKFGHVSGGTDREGREFITVYFSEKGSSRGKWKV